ncbi:SRPBCC domain-containing protein [Paeniglutamicibacter cryotolerans]|uniref:Activator of Hsp90 ATPase homologue 1/2-like C-terminal domain-containing protein n=1 Tax=Paeniglutamicibacter cryotolerans TaxID=670079 RepID=A0A839QTS2_9MICC|nr:SRPBCC domain-containing protein [Paeniglutamicibacter cryotolerans]MBB2997366.1 hypothetical protein [Paeniglutamicibacter cryotolerans]
MGAAGSIDAPAQLAAVTRTVVFSNEEGQSRYSVILSQDHPLAARDLWPALSDAGRLAQWFAVVGGDLRAGGTYAIANNATGTIERCQAPLGFSVSWEYEGELSRVGVRLDAREDATTLRLEHVCDIDGEVYPEYGPGAIGIGWDLALLGLAQHLFQGASVPPETTGWIKDPAALEFMEGSSRAWADASIAAGSEEHHARMAQERCTTAYVGIG